MKTVAGIFAGILLSLAVFAHWPALQLPEGTQADTIVVYKSQRKLVIRRGGETLKEYSVALGGVPIGPKTQEGDEKTPEGSYKIDYRKPDSAFHLALHISYPDEQEKSEAAARGVSPGGLIMVHGIRNGFGFLGRLHRILDWTNGCIAVTNQEIDEIARVVSDETPIDILP
ncbi:MAG: L,D-transpeptidase family protein [Gammaproteobacteria bacterium]|nr:L,D-transpeptidase family protein [Gammaproteobacteria bacterium]